eukprot:TRINITY_DN7192_c0_g1_i1.p2 TRINITY_DN7192_c0_g1~~TRINITY_DN7192_c0_g1_i1.p2  ORF type:complete len:385 (+),score=68.08 TRINITY_DN7192_c0_g1_i1:101-1255(+)
MAVVRKPGLVSRFGELVSSSQHERNRILLSEAVRDIDAEKLSDACFDAMLIERRGGTRPNLEPLLSRIQNERRRDKDCVQRAPRGNVSAKRVSVIHHKGVLDPNKYSRRYQESKRKDSKGNWSFGTQLTIDGIIVFIPTATSESPAMSAPTAAAAELSISVNSIDDTGGINPTLFREGYIAVSRFAKPLFSKLNQSLVKERQSQVTADAVRIQVDHAEEVINLSQQLKSEYARLSKSSRPPPETPHKVGARVRVKDFDSEHYGQIGIVEGSANRSNLLLTFPGENNGGCVQVSKGALKRQSPKRNSFLSVPSRAKKPNDKEQLISLQRYHSTPLASDDRDYLSVTNDLFSDETVKRQRLHTEERQQRVALMVTKRRYEYIRQLA